MTDIQKNCIGKCEHCVQPVLASQPWTRRDVTGGADPGGLLYHEDCWTYGENLDPKAVGWGKPNLDTSLSNKERRDQYSELDVFKSLDEPTKLAKELSGGDGQQNDGADAEGKRDSI